MNLSIDSQIKSICGWGRTKYSKAEIFKPNDCDEIKKIINSKSNSIISRGLGRSYGDAAQCSNGFIIDTVKFNDIYLDKDNLTLRAGAGVSFSDILDYIVPKGCFLPVSPGTKNVTVGGAISSDVHGKNHHKDGSFANHVLSILLIDGEGQIRNLSQFDKETSEFFWATAGGMGLTGVIIEATFKLIPISTSYIKVRSQKFNDIESLMYSMIENDKQYRYSVAWIDSLSSKGKGILTNGDHADLEELRLSDKKKYNNPLSYQSSYVPNAPKFLPNGILNNFTVGIFNRAWFAKVPYILENQFQSLSSFFHPLDGVNNWNRIYGSKGFIQYQFVIPDDYSYLVKKVLFSLREIGSPSFLTVLKRFGNPNNGLLSFPIKGWTLAVDIPAGISGIYETLNELDELIVKAGGRIYLAKDSRQSSEIFKSSYPKFKEWEKQKRLLDPNNVFQSELSIRLKI